MLKANLQGEASVSTSKSEAYKFLFESLYYTKGRSSRSENFTELAKLKNRHFTIRLPTFNNGGGISVEKGENSVTNYTRKESGLDHISENGQEVSDELMESSLKFNLHDVNFGYDKLNEVNEKNEEALDISYNTQDVYQPWVVLDVEERVAQQNLENCILDFSENIEGSALFSCNGDEEIEDIYTFHNSDPEKITTQKREKFDENCVSKIRLENNKSEPEVTSNKIWKDTADSKSKKNKSNSFYLGRTWFRGMSNYYKDKFEPMLKAWERDTANPERPWMDDQVSLFIKSEFTFDNTFYNSENFPEFLECMVTILHSQNHRRNVDYIKNRDFKLVRRLLYWYSSNAKKSFIENRNYAKIYNNFYIKGAEALVTEKSKDKYANFSEELRGELDDIHHKALQVLQN